MMALFYIYSNECEACNGDGFYDERLGGEFFSNPKARCPDCNGSGDIFSEVKTKKSKWVKVFKQEMKKESIKKDLDFWANTCWRENTSGECMALTPKGAAIELACWMRK